MHNRSESGKSAGFGLVETMIAAAVIAVLALGFAKLMEFNSRNTQSLTAKMDFISLVSAIQSVLSSGNCQTALSNQTFVPPAALPGAVTPPQALQPIRTNGAAGALIVPAAGTPFGKTLQITKLEWSYAAALAGPSQYLATLHLEADKVVGGGAVGGNTVSQDFRIPVTVNAANQIINCSGSPPNCQVCIQCSEHDEEGAYQWVDGAQECVNVNAGWSNWSEIDGSGDEEAGGLRCKVKMDCS